LNTFICYRLVLYYNSAVMHRVQVPEVTWKFLAIWWRWRRKLDNL